MEITNPDLSKEKHDKVMFLIKKDLDKGIAEIRSQLDWFNFILAPKAENLWPKYHTWIDYNLTGRRWWFKLYEVK